MGQEDIGAWGHLQGNVHMVSARISYERVMAGTGWTTSRPDCTHGQAYKMLLSRLVGESWQRLVDHLSISGKEGWLGSQQVYDKC